MPSLPYRQALCSLLAASVTSLALNLPQNPDGSLSLVQPSSLLLPFNVSAAIDNPTLFPNIAALLRAAKIYCDERQFGNPPAASCRTAVEHIPHDAVTVLNNPLQSYGPRIGGLWDFNLPKRFISSDGLCIIDLTQTSTPSHVRYNDLLAAGMIIQETCLEDDVPPFGGQASEMADEKNFLVTVRPYDPPSVRCSPVPAAGRPDPAVCQSLLDTMKASNAQTTFGALGVSDVQEHLPQVLTDPSAQCSLTIDIAAPEDTASWYDLWQAAVALVGMCVWGGMGGKARFLGANRKLTMEVKKS